MFILTIYGKETEGAYSVVDDEGEQILYLFEGEICLYFLSDLLNISSRFTGFLFFQKAALVKAIA